MDNKSRHTYIAVSDYCILETVNIPFKQETA